MKSSFAVNLSDLSREEKLQIFMGRTDITFRAIGERLGMTGAGVAKLLRGDTMPTARHAECVALGIPEECLPRPEDIKPGPKERRIPDLQNTVAA